MSERRRASRLVHSDYLPPADFGGLTTPIHRASTVTFPNVAAMRSGDWRRNEGYTYGLHGTPTTFTLEERIAELEGGRFTTLVPSGLAAIALIDLAFLKGGDEVLLPDNVYAPSRELAARMPAGLGVSVRYYDPLCGCALMIKPQTRLLWIEAPGSVTMEVPDVAALARVAREHGVISALDNTWSGGVLLQAFDLGVDLSMHALTKYPSGGSDVLMGSITTRDIALHERVREAHMLLGFGISGDDAYLVLRALPTLDMRVRQHGAAALQIARWLSGQPGIARVLHPMLADCPGHENFARQFSGAGGLFSVVFDASIEQARVDAFVDSLRLFAIGYSWGGARSLALPYAQTRLRSVTPWEQGSLVRLYIGLEDVEDLMADLRAALTGLVAHSPPNGAGTI